VAGSATLPGDNGAVSTRLPSLWDRPIGFAHRGARAHAPENTIEAFSLAIRLGATGLETDVWQTADGEIVCDHDGVVRRLWLRRKQICDLDRADLPDHIPSLAEVYASCGTDLPLSVDVKGPAAFEGLVAVARRHDAAERLWVCHEDIDTLIRWRDVAPEVNLVNSTRLARLPQGAERRAADLARERISAMNLRRADWTGGLTTLFHRFDVLAFGWDAQHDRHLGELVDMGIDAVYSDHVDRMVDVIEHYYG
jgi:glycerophosphoryl diester phosphodiesterase